MANRAQKAERTTASGNLLEKTVKTVCLEKGFTIVRYKVWEKSPGSFGRELLLTDVPYESIYGHKGKTEFLLKSDRYDLEMRIECKWQQVSGSVDEKLPYLYLNSIEAMHEKQIVVIIDGKGWKKGAIAWLKDAVEKRKYTLENSASKRIEVLSLAEFMTWANTIFR